MNPVTVNCRAHIVRHTTHSCIDATWSCTVEVYHFCPSQVLLRAMVIASKHRLRPVEQTNKYERGGVGTGPSRHQWHTTRYLSDGLFDRYRSGVNAFEPATGCQHGVGCSKRYEEWQNGLQRPAWQADPLYALRLSRQQKKWEAGPWCFFLAGIAACFTSDPSPSDFQDTG